MTKPGIGSSSLPPALLLAFAALAERVPPSRLSTLVLAAFEKLPAPTRDDANALASLEPDDRRPPAPAIVTALDRRAHGAQDELLLGGEATVIKDTLDVAGTPTSFGCREPVGIARSDAAIVRRLLAHGAHLVGKTDLTELAVGGLGIDRQRGAPLNPAAPGYLSGGSSSGTASAVAGGLARYGIGGDGLGSIRIPAACCGLVGLKPTYGVLPVEGYHSVGPSLDMAGPMARTVDDCERLWLALSQDPPAALNRRAPSSERSAEARSAEANHRALSSERSAAAGQCLQASDRARAPRSIGLIRGFDHEGASDALAEAVESVLERLGAPRVLVDLPLASQATMIGASIGALELRQRCPSLTTSTPEVAIAHMMGRHLRRDAERIQLARMAMRQSAYEALERCELIALPTTALPAPARRRDWLAGGVSLPLLLLIGRYTPLANCCGLPAIAVPCGVDGVGRPLSVMFVGRPHDESTLLAVAAAVESR